jgi:hypothetical protein
MMHGREKSDSAIVAGKPTNKAVPTAAEPVEPRAGAKENASQQSTHRTQGREHSTTMWNVFDCARCGGVARKIASRGSGCTGWPPTGFPQSGSGLAQPSFVRRHRVDLPRCRDVRELKVRGTSCRIRFPWLGAGAVIRRLG